MPRPRKPKLTRAPRGSGSVFKDTRRNCWVNRVPVGRKPDRSLRYREFRAATQEAVVALGKQATPPAASITLADWSARWLKSLDVREQSRDSYDTMLRMRILPAMGALAVSAITAFDIEEASRRWGLPSGDRVGITTIRHTLATLSACLQGAVRAGLLTSNVARLAKKPKATQSKIDPFTRSEWRTILDACLADRKLHPVALCAATGCRIGEALGLQVGDYSAATGALSIQRTVTRKRGVNPPKSRRGLRTIAVPPEGRGALALPYDTTRYRTIHSRWKALLPRLGIRYRGLHQLRHSVISHLVAAGTPVADVGKWVGDSVDMLVRVYLHPVGVSVSGALSGLLAGEPKQKGRAK